MIPSFALARICITLGLLPITGTAANWPSWRGPTNDGICTEKDLPTKWSSTENIAWSIPLPERGNSTPIVYGDKVFITQANSKEQRRELWCMSRKDGSIHWKTGVTFKIQEPTHATNPQCSASPVTDGTRVIVSFGSAGVVAYDMDGKELWHRDLGTQTHIWGNASSPVLSEGRVYLNFGPGERTFLIALNAATGETLWQHDEPGGNSGQAVAGQKRGQWLGSWSDPLLCNAGTRQELLMSYPGRLCALDPNSGSELWTCAGLNALIYTSPLHAEGTAVAMGGFSGMALAVKTGSKGDVTTQRLWYNKKSPQRIGSGAIYQGHIYIHNDPGTLMCMELTTGRELWSNRIKANGRSGTNWSSVMIANGLGYTVNQGGDCVVFKADPLRCEVVAVNPLGEHSNSSVSASQGQLFIRTAAHLWCVGKQ
jgi:outer membrane protein assembly factor BamB